MIMQTFKVGKMKAYMTLFMLGMLVCLASPAAQAQEDVSREQLKGLDEQVQEIKTDVLSIAAELSRLEEKLLFPSNTQVSVFVSLAEGQTFRLDAVEVSLGGQPVAHHIYTFKELEALRKGGVQRIYTGNVRSGEHDLQVSMLGKDTEGGVDLQQTAQFVIAKAAGPKIVEISLAAQGVTLKD